MALSGLERKLISTKERERYSEKINVISYADDFVVTGSSEQVLREKVIPILKEALQEVGLELSNEKTKITPIHQGFDFLGFNIRKYENGKLLIKPAKANVEKFLEEIKGHIKASVALPRDKMIHLLNPKITGWVNYYRSVVSSSTFNKVDDVIFEALKRWSFKDTPTKEKDGSLISTTLIIRIPLGGSTVPGEIKMAKESLSISKRQETLQSGAIERS